MQDLDFKVFFISFKSRIRFGIKVSETFIIKLISVGEIPKSFNGKNKVSMAFIIFVVPTVTLKIYVILHTNIHLKVIKNASYKFPKNKLNIPVIKIKGIKKSRLVKAFLNETLKLIIIIKFISNIIISNIKFCVANIKNI